ncbi:MAG: hypothetical protein AB8B81_04225 [Halioglobus sp.]
MRHRLTKIGSYLALIFVAAPLEAYEGSRYQSVHDTVFSKSYSTLPNYQVDERLFGLKGDGDSNALFAAAMRTLQSQQDIFDFPQGQKLLNANGICFSGVWIIDSASNYGGQFAVGTQSLAIVRASVALSGTRQPDKRAFGMAIKLFPTMNPKALVRTANAFVLHSLGGIRTKHLTTLALDNAPELGSLPSLTQWGTALRLRTDLEKADEAAGSLEPDSSYRSVAPLARLTNANARQTSTLAPAMLKLRLESDTPLIDEPDFRDELRLENYPQHKLSWVIEVAGAREKDKSKIEWQSLGRLVLSQSITSPGCDQQLHFAHPLNP